MIVPTQRPSAFDRDVDRLKRADTQPLRNDRGSKRVALPTALQEFAFSGWMCAWLPRKGTSSSGSRSMESVRLGESLEATKASPLSILSRTQQRQRKTLCSLSRRRGPFARLRQRRLQFDRDVDRSLGSVQSLEATHNHSSSNDRGSKRVALPTALQEFAFSGWMCAWLPRKGTSSSGSRSMESVRLGESLEATKASPLSILSRVSDAEAVCLVRDQQDTQTLAQPSRCPSPTRVRFQWSPSEGDFVVRLPIHGERPAGRVARSDKSIASVPTQRPFAFDRDVDRLKRADTTTLQRPRLGKGSRCPQPCKSSLSVVGCVLGSLGRGLRRPAPDPWRASGWASRSKRQKHRLSLSSPEPSNVSAKRFAPCPDAEAVCVRQRRRPPQACRHTTTLQRPRLEKGRAAHSPARVRFQRLDVCLAPSEGDFVVRLPIHGERPAGRVARSDKSIASLYPLPNPATSAQNALLLVPTQRPFAFDRDVDRLKRAGTQPLRNDRGSKRVALPTALQEFAFSGWMCAWLPRKETSSSGSRSMESVRLGESLEATKASPLSILSRTQQRQRKTLCSLSRRRGRLRSTETSTASSVQTHNHSATTAARKGSRCPQRCRNSPCNGWMCIGSLRRGLRRPAPDPRRVPDWASRPKRQEHRLLLSLPVNPATSE